MQFIHGGEQQWHWAEGYNFARDACGRKFPRGAQTEVKTRLGKLEMFHPEWDIHTWGFMNLASVHKEQRQEGRGKERGGKWQKDQEFMAWRASTHCHLLASLRVISVQLWLWVNNGLHKWSSDPLFNFLILLDSSEKTEQPKQPITVLSYTTEVKLGLR